MPPNEGAAVPDPLPASCPMLACSRTGAQMHIHLPKPLHGWREFVGEVGIIVIGVLIALGAEQVVEAMHWRSEVEAARQSLYDTVPGNLNAAKWRQQQQPCVDRRLAEIDQI